MELPSFKKRLYLSGIDWLIATMDRHASSRTGAGNHSTLIIEFDGRLDAEALKERLDEISKALPLLFGRVSRDLVNLAPYWRTDRRARNLKLETAEAADEKAFDGILRATLNRPFSGKREHLRFALVRRGNRGDALLMTFDHKILDAKGAEMFLRLLSDDGWRETLAETAEAAENGRDPVLRDWREQFESGKTVQRKMIAASKEGCFGASDTAENPKNRPPASARSEFGAAFAEFDSETTPRISRAAERNAGFMMETPFLLAVSATALRNATAPGTDIRCFVPVPLDTRSKPPSPKETFFNHHSFVFFHFDVGKDASLKEISHGIRAQLMEAVADDFPAEMERATRPLRIFPKILMAKAMDLPFDGKICSFAFANVGVSAAPEEILGLKVESIRHMPRTPSPPGLGMFFNSRGGKLAATVSADSALWPAETAEKTIDEIEKILRGEADRTADGESL